MQCFCISAFKKKQPSMVFLCFHKKCTLLHEPARSCVWVHAQAVWVHAQAVPTPGFCSPAVASSLLVLSIRSSCFSHSCGCKDIPKIKSVGEKNGSFSSQFRRFWPTVRKLYCFWGQHIMAWCVRQSRRSFHPGEVRENEVVAEYHYLL